MLHDGKYIKKEDKNNQHPKQEFNELQMDVINRGLEEGLDVSSFAKPELDWEVMQEAMYALKDGVDLTPYLVDFDSWQLSVIKEGLKEGYDVSVYANPAHGHWEMEQILEGLRSGVDVSKYNDIKFHHDQMEFIRLQLEKGVNVDAFANPDYVKSQMDIISMGLKDGVDVSIYANPNYSVQQMDVIRGALVNGEDVSAILDPKIGAYKMYHILKAARYEYKLPRQFTGSQAFEITSGLERGIDVSIYDKLNENGEPVFDSFQMEQIRKGLSLHLDYSKFAKPEYTRSKMLTIIKELVKEQYKEYFNKFDVCQLKTIFDGILEDIDYEIYTKPEYDARQMREIYIGLRAGLDVSFYAKPEYDIYQMSIIRRGLRDGIDVSSYLDPNLTSDEMYDIYENLCKMKRN